MMPTAIPWLHLLWAHQSPEIMALVMLSAPLVWHFGRQPERMATMAILLLFAQNLLTPLLAASYAPDTDFTIDDPSADVVCLALLTLVAVKANRFYPLVMAAGELIAVMAHALHAAHLIDNHPAYLLINVSGSYISIVALWVGTFQHWRRQRRSGPYPDWCGG